MAKKNPIPGTPLRGAAPTSLAPKDLGLGANKTLGQGVKQMGAGRMGGREWEWERAEEEGLGGRGTRPGSGLREREREWERERERGRGWEWEWERAEEE